VSNNIPRFQPEFTSPSGGESYVRDVADRCEDLIHTHVWAGIDVDRLREWLNNFDGREPRYFAARLLDSLIYRSPAQTTSLMVQQFQRVLPDLTRTAPSPLGIVDDWIEAFASGSIDPGMRLVPVIRFEDPPTKSGPLVCRLLRRNLGLNDHWMIWPWLPEVQRALERGIRVFVFVDDFLGTGKQFIKFFAPLYQILEPSDAYMAYSPLAAYEPGIAKVRKRFPLLNVNPVERLDESHCLFHPSSLHFNDGINSPMSARQFYLGFMKTLKPSLNRKFTLGYSELGMAFAFAHATPNSTLPVFWLQRPPLRPLFVR
jgi:hypothetical protein